jgi:hypothetical protein
MCARCVRVCARAGLGVEGSCKVEGVRVVGMEGAFECGQALAAGFELALYLSKENTLARGGVS